MPWRVIVATVLAALGLATPAAAAPGEPDTSFGEGGATLLQLGDASLADYATSVAVAPGGHIVVGGVSDGPYLFNGQWTLVRLDARGELDPAFGDGGVAATGPAGWLADVALDGDGIVAAGAACEVGVCDPAVARYRSDGTLDPAFGTDGVLRIPNFCHDQRGGFARITEMAPGWIVAGWYPRSPCDTDELNTLFARVTSDGELDGSFANAGRYEDYTVSVALAVVPGGGLAIVRYEEELARLTASGLHDPSYATTDTDAIVSALLALPDGRVAVAGSRPEGPGIAMTLPGGGLDPGFGVAGWARAPFVSDRASRIVRQASGALVLTAPAGVDCGYGDTRWELSRFSPEGVIDAGFGLGGQAVVPTGGQCFTGPDLATGPGDRLVLAGSTHDSGERSGFIVVALDGGPAKVDTGDPGDPPAITAPAPTITVPSPAAAHLPAISDVGIRALRHGRIRVTFTAPQWGARLVIKAVAARRTLGRRVAYAWQDGRQSVALRIRRSERGRRAVARRARVRVSVAATAPASDPVRANRTVRLRR